MSTLTEALASNAILKAAASAAETVGPPATKKGDARLTGDGRRKIIHAAITSMSTEERSDLAALSDEDTHRWIAVVLDHSKALLAGAAGYLETINTVIGKEHAAESVIGPKGVRNVVKNLAKEAAKKAVAKTESKDDEPVVITAPKQPPKKAPAKKAPAKSKK